MGQGELEVRVSPLACRAGEDTGIPSCSPTRDVTEGLGALDRVSLEV